MHSTLDLLSSLAQAGDPPTAWIWTMAIGFMAICIIMMLVVLIQKPKGGGLSGAFGGGAGGGSESAFIGGRVGDVLTWTTVVCFVLFLVLAMGMTWGINGTVAPTEDDETTTEQVESEADASDADTAADANTESAPDASTTTESESEATIESDTE